VAWVRGQLHRQVPPAGLGGAPTEGPPQLDDHADRYRQLAIQASFPKRNELDEHRLIMDATIARQADEAVALLTKHYRRTGEIILESQYELPE